MLKTACFNAFPFSFFVCIQYVMVRFAPYGHFFTDLPYTETRTSRLGGFPGRDEEEMYGFTLRLDFSHQEIL